MRSRILRTPVIPCALLCLMAPAVWAEEFPATDESCINDHANVVRDSDTSKIRSLCKKADKNKVKMMVVTIDSMDSFHPRPLSIDRFADGLFDDWDTGYDEKADAILLLVIMKENQFRVLMGEGYRDKLRSRASQIIVSSLVPDFRRKNPSSGVRKAYTRLYEDVVLPRIREIKKEEKKNNRPMITE